MPPGQRPGSTGRPDLFATLDYQRDEDYIEHYRELLTTTVKRLSRTYRPLACEVSGGLDSSAIYAVAEQLRRGGELLAPDLAGYTMNFAGDPDADEIAYCRAVGAHLNKPVTEVPPLPAPAGLVPRNSQAIQGLPGHAQRRDGG